MAYYGVTSRTSRPITVLRPAALAFSIARRHSFAITLVRELMQHSLVFISEFCRMYSFTRETTTSVSTGPSLFGVDSAADEVEGELANGTDGEGFEVTILR